MKYRQWLDEWLSANVKPCVKVSTYRKYGAIAEKKISPKLGEYELDELSPIILQNFTAELTRTFSPNTTSGIVGVLRSSLKRAQQSGVVAYQFSENIELPRAREKKIGCFSAAEQKCIEHYILSAKPDKLFGILLCFYSGLRVGELLALKWSDIDLAKGTITVNKSCRDRWENGVYRKEIDTPKTETSERVIPLPKQFLPLLKAYKRESGGRGYVVGGEDGNISIRSYQRSFELLLKRLRLPHRGFHAIRHTFATRALECGMDVKTLSEILGHKNPSVTLRRYVHSLMEHKSAMMNRLGKLLQ